MGAGWPPEKLLGGAQGQPGGLGVACGLPKVVGGRGLASRGEAAVGPGGGRGEAQERPG